MSGRFVRLGIALAGGLLVTGCASVGGFIGDSLPTWAGGLPPGTPPRAGAPGYDAYIKSTGEQSEAGGEQPAKGDSQPAAPPAAPPRKPADERIH